MKDLIEVARRDTRIWCFENKGGQLIAQRTSNGSSCIDRCSDWEVEQVSVYMTENDNMRHLNGFLQVLIVKPENEEEWWLK